MAFLLPAFMLGLLGSFHCVGMCGPIAMALPVMNNTYISRITGIILYNGGRIITYALLGFVFGLLGRTFVLAGYQQHLSIALGLLILLGLLFTHQYGQVLFGVGPAFQLFSRLKRAISKLFRTRAYGSLLMIGVLNGFLPCGLVYAAIAGAIITAQPIYSSMFMAFFGLGTLPVMLIFSLAAQKISMRWRTRFRQTVPLFILAMAILLILRGLNLGIPYVSPELSRVDCTKHSCCNKK